MLKFISNSRETGRHVNSNYQWWSSSSSQKIIQKNNWPINKQKVPSQVYTVLEYSAWATSGDSNCSKSEQILILQRFQECSGTICITFRCWKSHCDITKSVYRPGMTNVCLENRKKESGIAFIIKWCPSITIWKNWNWSFSIWR